MKQLDFNFYYKKRNDLGYKMYKHFFKIEKVWDARRYCENNLEKRIFNPINCNNPSARTLRQSGVVLPNRIKEAKDYLKQLYPVSKISINKMNSKQVYSTLKTIVWFKCLGKEYCSFKGYI